MRELLAKVLPLLSTSERRQLYGLSVITAMMALMEVAGIASIVPFLAVLGNPDIVHSNQWLSWFYASLGFQTNNGFLFFLGLLVFFVLVLNNGFAAFTTWVLLRFTHMRNQTVSQRLLTQYLHQPYHFFLGRNSADLARKIFSEVAQVIGGVIMPCVQLVAKLMVALFVVTLLVIVDPLLTALIMSVLGGTYTVIYLVARTRLSDIGRKRVTANEARFKAASEAFGGIKDIKLLGKEAVYINSYAEASRRFARYQAASQLVSQLPSYALQSIAFGGILVIVLYLLTVRESLGDALPLIGLYAFAGYRIMPALHQIFANLTRIRFSLPALDDLYDDFAQASAVVAEERDLDRITRLSLADKLSLSNISFRYPATQAQVIDNIDITILANTSVGLVGTTGSGKTTLVDLILGLLSPETGYLVADGIRITDINLRAWQNNLGYVPQHIYLTDDTIRNNIAFGVKSDVIDEDAVRKAARIANIGNFIINELPHGYDTVVGERGIRLSGGQRQRIGIARALYHEPSVLVLDEATSAVDNVTENAIMDALRALAHQKTIIMIAHRLSTVRECDVIHVLEKGRIIASGTYEELLQGSESFREMAQASSGL